MEVTGVIDFIGFTESVSPTFNKREVWVTTQEQYAQTLNIQFTQDKCNILDNFQVGQLVTIGINLRGNKVQNQQTTEWKCFNTIQGWKIDPAQQQGYGPQGYQGQGSAVNAYQQQHTQGYGQPQQNFQQPQQGYGQPMQNNNPSYGGVQNYGQQQGYTQSPNGNFSNPPSPQQTNNQPYP